MAINRSRTVIAVAATGALLIGSSAFAATALDPAEPLQACVNKTNGNMRLTAYGATCKTEESPITWNAQGPQGPQGPEASVPNQVVGRITCTVPNPWDGIMRDEMFQNCDVEGTGFTVVDSGIGYFKIRFDEGIFEETPVVMVESGSSFISAVAGTSGDGTTDPNALTVLGLNPLYGQSYQPMVSFVAYAID